MHLVTGPSTEIRPSRGREQEEPQGGAAGFILPVGKQQSINPVKPQTLTAMLSAFNCSFFPFPNTIPSSLNKITCYHPGQW